jgi:hypothetical protein
MCVAAGWLVGVMEGILSAVRELLHAVRGKGTLTPVCPLPEPVHAQIMAAASSGVQTLLQTALSPSLTSRAARPPQVAFANGPHSYGLAKTVFDVLDITVEWTFLIDIFLQFFMPVQPLLVRHDLPRP